MGPQALLVLAGEQRFPNRLQLPVQLQQLFALQPVGYPPTQLVQSGYLQVNRPMNVCSGFRTLLHQLRGVGQVVKQGEVGIQKIALRREMGFAQLVEELESSIIEAEGEDERDHRFVRLAMICMTEGARNR